MGQKKFRIQAGKYCLELGERTHIMGVINITPDSFSQDGCLINEKATISKALLIAKQFQKNGADIIDIGGESTRPGAKRISVKEEKQRVIPVLKALVKEINLPISIDTYKYSVAKAALENGVSIINNIMGANLDIKLLKLIKDYHCAVVLMHMQGTPKGMQKNIKYTDVIKEIIFSLKNSIELCLEYGIQRNQIIIDPGIGFGKTVEHNLQIINDLKDFQTLKQPILMGTSRKSFIGKVLNKEVNQRLYGTIATVCASIINGANIVRVHDVKEVKETVQMLDAIRKV